MNHIDDGAGRFGGLGRTMGTRGVSLFVKRSRRTVRTEEGLGNLCLFMQMDGAIQDIFRPWFTRCPSHWGGSVGGWGDVGTDPVYGLCGLAL